MSNLDLESSVVPHALGRRNIWRFPEIGVPLYYISYMFIIQLLDWDFPWNQPSSLGYLHHLRTAHLFEKNLGVGHGELRIVGPSATFQRAGGHPMATRPFYNEVLDRIVLPKKSNRQMCEWRYLPWMTHQKITCYFAVPCHFIMATAGHFRPKPNSYSRDRQKAALLRGSPQFVPSIKWNQNDLVASHSHILPRGPRGEVLVFTWPAIRCTAPGWRFCHAKIWWKKT